MYFDFKLGNSERPISHFNGNCMTRKGPTMHLKIDIQAIILVPNQSKHTLRNLKK
jgi:hypothetical protein